MYISTDKIIFSLLTLFGRAWPSSGNTYICDNEVGLLLVWYCSVHMCIKHQHIVDIKTYIVYIK